MMRIIIQEWKKIIQMRRQGLTIVDELDEDAVQKVSLEDQDRNRRDNDWDSERKDGRDDSNSRKIFFPLKESGRPGVDLDASHTQRRGKWDEQDQGESDVSEDEVVATSKSSKKRNLYELGIWSGNLDNLLLLAPLHDKKYFEKLW